MQRKQPLVAILGTAVLSGRVFSKGKSLCPRNLTSILSFPLSHGLRRDKKRFLYHVQVSKEVACCVSAPRAAYVPVWGGGVQPVLFVLWRFYSERKQLLSFPWVGPPRDNNAVSFSPCLEILFASPAGEPQEWIPYSERVTKTSALPVREGCPSRKSCSLVSHFFSLTLETGLKWLFAQDLVSESLEVWYLAPPDTSDLESLS